MGLGGLVAGLSVALLSGLVSRTTPLREDASFASFICLTCARRPDRFAARIEYGPAACVVRHHSRDRRHGSLPRGQHRFADSSSFLRWFIDRSSPSASNPGFLRAVGGRGPLYHFLFLFLVVINLVAGFQALGTLMAVGLMMLPAVIAQLWARTLPIMLLIATSTAALSGLIGLLVSFHFGFASGPTIILTASLVYGASLLISPSGAIRRLFPRPHLAG